MDRPTVAIGVPRERVHHLRAKAVTCLKDGLVAETTRGEVDGGLCASRPFGLKDECG